ncbi:MAG: hypothetical protein JWM80_6133, partial [Cyanobacteria bacterium RYN_339]|nr:hypothetical protein [Cyanobacteria bacterium RYN_339]
VESEITSMHRPITALLTACLLLSSCAATSPPGALPGSSSGPLGQAHGPFGGLRQVDMGYPSGGRIALRFPTSVTQKPGYKLKQVSTSTDVDRYVIRLSRTTADELGGLRVNQQVVTQLDVLNGTAGVYFTNVQPGDYLVQLAVLAADGTQLAQEVSFAAPPGSGLSVKPGHPDGDPLSAGLFVDANTIPPEGPEPSAVDTLATLNVDVLLYTKVLPENDVPDIDRLNANVTIHDPVQDNQFLEGGSSALLQCAPFTNIVSTLAGTGTAGFADGAGATAQFNNPGGVAVDTAGNAYVADQDNHRVRKVTATGVVSTLAGSGTAGFADGAGATARFISPFGVAVDTGGNVYVADFDLHRIRKVTPAGLVSTLAGSGTQGYADGAGATARFSTPTGLAVDINGNVYVAEVGNNRIRKVTSAGVVSTLAGDGTIGFADGAGATAKFAFPIGVAVDLGGNVYVADSANHRIRKVTSAGVVSTVAGSGIAGFADGAGATARFSNPYGVAVDTGGNIYVADKGNHRIRKVTSAGVVSTLSGDGTNGFADGASATARFSFPSGVTVDACGKLFVADQSNQRIRQIQ